MIGFKINNDHTLGNVHVTESLSPETDKELLKCFQSYRKTINATPGNYTMGFVLAIKGLLVKDSLGQVKGIGGFNFGKKIRTANAPRPNTLTIMLTGKELQLRSSKTKERPLIQVASAKNSFIELKTIRFKNIANFIKPKSPGCQFDVTEIWPNRLKYKFTI